jgi:hypothetical protein
LEKSRLFEITNVLVRLDHVASIIVNANHRVVRADETLTAFLELESARLNFGQSCSLVLPFHLSIPMNSISVSFHLQKEPVVCPQCGIDSPLRSRPLSEVYAFAGHCCLWRHQ